MFAHLVSSMASPKSRISSSCMLFPLHVSSQDNGDGWDSWRLQLCEERRAPAAETFMAPGYSSASVIHMFYRADRAVGAQAFRDSSCSDRPWSSSEPPRKCGCSFAP